MIHNFRNNIYASRTHDTRRYIHHRYYKERIIIITIFCMHINNKHTNDDGGIEARRGLTVRIQ